ncbi:MAG: iron ABC transporter permease [Planctomycetota bacterium]|nr:iron ABC transporter permease [Planctomycetota bacterium]
MPRLKPAPTVLLLGALLLGAVALRLAIGRAPGGGLTWSFESLDLRGARVGAGMVVGGCLGLAGVFLQSLLRNVLASPDILGLASGSGLGVMIAAYVGYLGGQGLASADVLGVSTAGAAVAGALVALALVYALSVRRGVLDPITLVLVGVGVSIMASAGTMIVRHLLPDQGESAARLLLGSIRDAGWWEIGAAGLALAGGLAVGCVGARAMDVASLSEDEARSAGVRLGRLRGVLFVASGVLTAASVVLAGPVGFVGLVCPHVVRLLAGPGHRTLVPGSVLAGAALVVGCDVLVRAVDLGAGHLPLGALTSLIGAPVLIGMLRSARRGTF